SRPVEGSEFLVLLAQFLVHRQGHLDGLVRQGLDDQPADGLIDTSTGNLLAQRTAVLRRLALAVVSRVHAAPPVLVAKAHAPTAAPTNQQPLQQGGAFPRRRHRSQRTTGHAVLLQRPLVGLKLLQANVAGVSVGDKYLPLLARQSARRRPLLLPCPAVEVHA